MVLVIWLCSLLIFFFMWVGVISGLYFLLSRFGNSGFRILWDVGIGCLKLVVLYYLFRLVLFFMDRCLLVMMVLCIKGLIV